MSRHHSAFAAAPQAMCVYEPATLRVIALNAAAQRFFHLNNSSSEPASLADLRMPEGAPLYPNLKPGTPMQRRWRISGSGCSFEVCCGPILFGARQVRLLVIQSGSNGDDRAESRTDLVDGRLREAPAGYHVTSARSVDRGNSASNLPDPRAWLESRVIQAVEREQERIGRDLHDGLCQLLIAVKYRVALLERLLERGQIDQARLAAGVEQMVNDAIDHARGLARGLNPSRLGGTGLMRALEDLAEVTRATRQIQCTFRARGVVVVDDDNVANHLYRIAQEAVQNAMKHGRPRSILVMLTQGNGRLDLAIKDDGVGISGGTNDTAGAGLENMKTRARLVGGSLEIFRRKNGGTAVICSLPHDPPTQNAAGREGQRAGSLPGLPR